MANDVMMEGTLRMPGSAWYCNTIHWAECRPKITRKAHGEGVKRI